MKWATRTHVHFDRVATPWLIKRLVDPSAEFLFLPWGEEDKRPADAIPFGIPDVELATHDREATTFDRVLVKYGLADDPALARLARIVHFGVGTIIFNQPPPSDRVGRVVEGIVAVIEGIMLNSASDAEVIERALPVFDGLHALCRVEATMEARADVTPAPGVGEPMWLTTFLTAVLFRARKGGQGFDGREIVAEDAAFEAELGAVRGNLQNLAKDWN